MNDMTQDPMFWYAVAFVIFIGLAYKYGKTPLLGWLDSEILKIRNELAQARKLRDEAEATLAEYKVKQIAALAEAEAIIAHAQQEADRLKAQAASDLQSALEKHEKQAAERIRLAESEAIEAVRQASIDHAMKIATETLSKKADETSAAKLIDQAIADMPKGDPKAKAA